MSCSGTCCYCENRCSYASTAHKAPCACKLHRAAHDSGPATDLLSAVEVGEHGGFSELLDRVTDVVLAYRPKPKTKAAKKRARRKKRKKKRD